MPADLHPLRQNGAHGATRILSRAESLAHSSIGVSDLFAKSMNLLVRINLALALAFALAALAVGWACSYMLQANAKRESLREAGLMMDSALSMRAYTSEEIVPLLNAQLSKEFLPQSVPSYAATQNFLKLRDHHPEYAYREATLNPTNLRDRAVEWETGIVQQFRNDVHMSEIVGERDTPTGTSLYNARPIRAEPSVLYVTARRRRPLRPCSRATVAIMASAGNPTRWSLRRSCRCRLPLPRLTPTGSSTASCLRSWRYSRRPS